MAENGILLVGQALGNVVLNRSVLHFCVDLAVLGVLPTVVFGGEVEGMGFWFRVGGNGDGECHFREIVDEHLQLNNLLVFPMQLFFDEL
jgi:hypothetical protein